MVDDGNVLLATGLHDGPPLSAAPPHGLVGWGGEAMINRMLQSILSLFRSCGIDLYAIMVRILYRWRWWRACSWRPAAAQESICIAVELDFVQSFAQVGRDFIDKIKSTTIPFHVYDMSLPFGGSRRMPRDAYARYLPFTRKSIDESVVLFFSQTPSFPSNRICIPQLFWEFESGYVERGADFTNANDYVVFSDFCLEYFRRIVPPGCHVHKIRYPYVPGRWRKVLSKEAVRGKYGIPEGAFVAFFHFDAGSCCDRKNPEGVVRAFADGLRDYPDALLVIKTMYYDEGSAYARRMSALISDLGIEHRVRIVNECIPYQDVLDLIASSDVYISLHRGEGLGIGMMEAMALETPVICTNYGGNTDFTKPDTAFLVDYKMVPAQTEHPVYRYVKEWPEPDVAQAAEHLRALHQDRNLGRLKASHAIHYLDSFFSVEKFEEDVRTMLRSVNGLKGDAK